jgi:hypothetical protein
MTSAQPGDSTPSRLFGQRLSARRQLHLTQRLRVRIRAASCHGRAVVIANHEYAKAASHPLTGVQMAGQPSGVSVIPSLQLNQLRAAWSAAMLVWWARSISGATTRLQSGVMTSMTRAEQAQCSAGCAAGAGRRRPVGRSRRLREALPACARVCCRPTSCRHRSRTRSQTGSSPTARPEDDATHRVWRRRMGPLWGLGTVLQHAIRGGGSRVGRTAGVTRRRR